MAEIALGVIPILVSACDGFGVLLEKIHTFRHHKEEIEWLRRRVKTQFLNYSTQIHHLFVATLRVSGIANQDIPGRKDLTNEFKKYMGELFVDFETAVEDIRGSLDSIQNKLDAFALLEAKPDKLKTIKGQLKWTFRKERYEKDVERLKEEVSGLKVIREAAEAFVQPSTTRNTTSPNSNLATNNPASQYQLNDDRVKQYRAIRSLSSKFQEFLGKQCCTSHYQHSGKLFLTSAPGDRINIAVFHESVRYDGCGAAVSRKLFNVRSPLPPAEGDTTPRPHKKPRLSPPSGSLGDSRGHEGGSHAAENTMTSLCKALDAISLNPVIRFEAYPRTMYYQIQPPSTQSNISGRVQTPSILSTRDLPSIKSHPLSYLLDFEPELVLGYHERIQLAAALARAMLMAYSTAGWPGHRLRSSGCILEGLFFLMDDSDGAKDISSAITLQRVLDTLNIPVEIGSNTEANHRSNLADVDMPDAGPGDGSSPHPSPGALPSIEEQRDQWKLEVGVSNIVLYWLGVALLSLALWKRIDWADVVAVRKKAASLTWGGTAYKAAVKRLIECKFTPLSNDLEDERLQYEVFRDIVDSLENTVENVRISAKKRDTSCSQPLDQVALRLTDGPIFEDPESCVGPVQYSYPAQEIAAN